MATAPQEKVSLLASLNKERNQIMGEIDVIGGTVGPVRDKL